MSPSADGPGRPTLHLLWRQLFEEACQALGDRQVARWFLEDASGDRWPGVLDDPVPARAGEVFTSMLQRHLGGEPAQYVLGHWSFRHLDLMVSRHVLIPRPETEVVVDVALAELDRCARGRPRVIDLGTGSGAIALSMAVERPWAEVWATDVSEGALGVASANLAGLGTQAAGRVHLRLGSWWEAVPTELAGTVDLVVSNPPYVSQHELAELAPQVRDWEPLEALVPGPSGLEALEQVIEGCPRWLAPSGALVAEIAPHQAEQATELARSAGFAAVLTRPDLAGRLRALVARRQP